MSMISPATVFTFNLGPITTLFIKPSINLNFNLLTQDSSPPWNKDQDMLGIVDYFVETGSNNVLVVKGKKEHWIPYIEPFLVSIDSKNQEILVDWDKDF